jgi:acetyltransferase-like isoleucine patch superfamily enzyme
MTSLRRAIATSDHPLARSARTAYRAYNGFTLPAPSPVVKPMLWLYLGGRTVIHFLRRVLIAEPLFKAYCTSYGRGVRTGIFVQWVEGKGELIVGDHVRIWGKASFTFAARFSDRPRLEIGDRTSIGHGVAITVATHVRIGRDCHIAGGTRIFDSSGHPADPAKRLAGLPPDPDEIKPVVIGDNVWLGANAVIFPGVTIGDGAVVATSSVVTGDVPPNTLVAGYPARRIKQLVEGD